MRETEMAMNILECGGAALGQNSRGSRCHKGWASAREVPPQKAGRGLR